jgi:hypothetical protein
VATTAVFAEILIVGLEAEALLAMLVVTYFGHDWIDPGEASKWAALVSVLVLAAAYMLGIIVDRLADSAAHLARRPVATAVRLARAAAKRMGPTRRTEEPQGSGAISEAEKRIFVLAETGGLTAFLEYQRSRLRVARGTVLMSLAALPVTAVFLDDVEAGPARSTFVLVLVATLLVASVVAAGRIGRAYSKRLSEAYDLLESRAARE